jgi:hypothetical protein
MPLPDFRVPSSACPFGGKDADAAAAVTGFHRPSPGDAMLCVECGAWSIYTAAMGRRPPTMDETEAITLDPQAQRAWLYWARWASRR